MKVSIDCAEKVLEFEGDFTGEGLNAIISTIADRFVDFAPRILPEKKTKEMFFPPGTIIRIEERDKE